jgi:hypothetical protein
LRAMPPHVNLQPTGDEMCLVDSNRWLVTLEKFSEKRQNISLKVLPLITKVEIIDPCGLVIGLFYNFYCHEKYFTSDFYKVFMKKGKRSYFLVIGVINFIAYQINDMKACCWQFFGPQILISLIEQITICMTINIGRYLDTQNRKNDTKLHEKLFFFF